jgi:hypothetical protein
MTTLWTGTSPKDLDNDDLLAVLYQTNLTSPEEVPLFSYHPLSATPPNPNNPERHMFYSNEPRWKVWKEKLPTTTSTRLDVSELGLSKDEYIVGLKVVYGGVEKDFFTGRGWQLSSDPHTLKPSEALFDEWLYAVVATDALCSIDDMGKETVMRASVKANLSRNFSLEGKAVLTDVDTDAVETRVIDSFEVPTKSLGLTTVPNEALASLKNEAFFGFPYTADPVLFVFVLVAFLGAAGLSLVCASTYRAYWR